MARADSTPIARMLKTWRKLESLPAGKWIFSRLLGRFAPYSGSICANVVKLEPGYALIALRDRRRVRNHLRSIHAIALANLGELTSGLAVMSALPNDIRGIITGLSMEYLKKARGRLLAESRCKPPEIAGDSEDITYEVITEIRDSQEDIVARAKVIWRLGIDPGTRQ
ncbi:MAG: hotdog fold domain-containing protein [Acidiferrobacterales bacterium]|nr:hotdog fold domain-containing protein [Acidiferrobacterales bacterium]